jgi:selenocysteine-specific elongation factor
VGPVDAMLHVRAPLAAVHGQRFVVRRMSPKTVLGGGTIGVPAAADDEPSISPEQAAILAVLAANGIAAAEAPAIASAANVVLGRAAELLADEAAGERAWMLARPAAYVDATAVEALLERVLAVLERREAETPWVLGATSLALSRELEIAESLLVRILAAAAERQRVSARNGYFSTIGFEPQLSIEQTQFFAEFARIDPQQPLLPAPFEPLVMELRRSKIAGLAAALDTLLALGGLVRVGDHLYTGEQIAEIRTRLVRTLRAESRITAARFRDVVGTSRKYIVPLLEYFDATGVTVRDGDLRALRERR